jgi:type VI secretion system protein ImpG
VYLSLVDLGGNQFSDQRYSVDIETTCLNRDLPGRLPFGGGQPRLTVRDLKIPLESVKCLTPPTPTLRPPAGRQTLWRLISHLTLGHLSLTDGPKGAAALRETLALYDYRDTPETRDLIESLQEVSSAQIVGRLPDDTHAVVRGTEITLQFARENFSEKGLYLMSLVLERFFANHCTINSFIRLRVKLEGRDEVLETGPGRGGERILV